MNRNSLIIALTTTLIYIAVGMTALGLQVLFINKVPDFLIAILPAVYWTSALIFSPMWGILADSIGNRRIILIFTVSAAEVILLLHAIFISYIAILILRFIYGFFLSAFLPVSLSLLLIGIPREKTGKQTSIFTSSRSLGFLLSGYTASLILYLFNVIDLFIFGALLIGLAALFLIFIKDSNVAQGSFSNSYRRKTSFKHLLRLPGKTFITRNNGHLLVIALTLRHANTMGISALVYVYMLRKGIPDYLLGTISSFNTLAQILLMYPLGLLSDRIGRKPLIMTGFILSIIVPVSFIFSSNPISFAISFILIGVSFSTLISGAGPFLKDIAPKGKEGEALSFLNITRSLGAIIGPMIVSSLLIYSSYEVMFEVMAIITAIATLLAFMIEEALR